jgi:O-antigen/teichoic acid export membrane protein
MAKASFLRHAAVYGLGHVLVYVGSFILLPLYTKCLRPDEYGVLELLNRLGEILNLCLLYTALRQAAITFYNQAESEAEQHRVVGTLLVVLLALGGIGFGAATWLAPVLNGGLEVGSSTLVQLAIGAALLEGTTFTLLALPQARTESSLFAGINVCQLLLRVGLGVWFVWGLDWGVRGVLLSTALTSATFVMILLGREAFRSGICIDRQKLREFATFSWPFLPGGLCLFVLNSGDRFLLKHYTDAAAVGVYALGYKMASLVTTFSVTPLLMVWGARMYDAARLDDAPEVFGRVTTRILGAHLLVGLAVCLFQDEIIAILAGPAYRDAATVIAPVVLAFWFLSAVSLMDAGFYVRRCTGKKTCVTAAATVVVLGLYLLLIPPFGGLGAAAATIGGFLFQAVLTRGVVQRLFFVRYEDRRLAAMLGSAVLLWALSRLLPSTLWSAPVKVAVWLLWPALLWVAGVITDDEKHWVAESLMTLRRRRHDSLMEEETHDGQPLSRPDDTAECVAVGDGVH